MARKKDEEMREEETVEDIHGSRVYEIGFHIDPELPQEEVKKVYQSVHSAIEKAGGIVAAAEPQKIPLAYTISRQETTGRRDFNSAFFAWIAYETSAERHGEILELVKENPSIFRFIDLVTTKDAARHASEMNEIHLKVPQEETESVSDTELDAALESAAA